MSYRLECANLGWCGPDRAGRTPDAWADDVRQRAVDAVCIQEAPSQGWVIEAFGDAYSVHQPRRVTGDNSWCRSAVAVRRATAARASTLELRNANYHGSYVAAAEVELPSVGTVTVLSVHASPRPLSGADLSRWSGDRPPARSGIELWDADFVLDTVRELLDEGRALIAAGDWNEARTWDNPAGVSAEFFDRVHALGLSDVTYTAWKGECPTHRNYQDDHIFATGNVAALMQDVDLDASGLSGSDHLHLSAVFG